RPPQVLPINQRHDRAVFLAGLRRPAVDRSAGDRQQSALSRYRQRWSLALDQTAPFRPAHLPSFVTKRSYEGGRLVLCLGLPRRQLRGAETMASVHDVRDPRRRFMRQSNSARRAGSLPSLVLIAIGRAFIGSPAASARLIFTRQFS